MRTGGQHLGSRYDGARARWLEARGFAVFRFWNNEALGNLEMVLVTISRHAEES